MGHAGEAGAEGDDLVGRVQEKLGWLTADRRAEAKGKLRRLDAGDDREEGGAEEAAEQAERDVREDYGEYDPAVDGAEPARDEPRPD